MHLLPKRLQGTLLTTIGDSDLATRGRGRRYSVNAARVALAVASDLAEGRLALRAMSLVYTTLLALVPLLAVSFSVLKAFGVHNQAGPLLERFLAPLGPEAADLSLRLLGFVENVKIGVLGSLGIALLFYTVVSVLQKIEAAFNEVWRVGQTRRLTRRFSDYLSVMMVGPVLVFSALGLTASLLRHNLVQRALAIEPLGSLVLLGTRLVPYLLVIGAFAFVYVYMTNTRMQLRAALVGATCAGVLWQSVGWGFATFVAASGSYAAIYSGFAILVLFMIWLYASWLILLIGSAVAFYTQHPAAALPGAKSARLGAAQRERVGLALMYLVAERHTQKGSALTADSIARRLHLTADALAETLDLLLAAGLLAQTAPEPCAIVPGRDPGALTLDELLATLRSGDALLKGRVQIPAVDQLTRELDRAATETLGTRTLRDLVESAKATPVSAPQP